MFQIRKRNKHDSAIGGDMGFYAAVRRPMPSFLRRRESKIPGRASPLTNPIERAYALYGWTEEERAVVSGG